MRRSFLVLALFMALGGGRQCPARQLGDLPEAENCATAADAPAVRVTTKREGNSTHFFVSNEELCEVTMTFVMTMQNLRANQQFPLTTTLLPGKTTEVFTLAPVCPDAKWLYDYTNYYKLGSACARHDDSVVYLLPYLPGNKFRVTQGYNGSFSHKGSNKYSIDWKMPEGTPVCAARGGVVVRAKDDSSMGGSSMNFDIYNNYILIRHDDGTLGHYCHLEKGGALVRQGQRVSAGQVIGRSGTTGFSSGPHLHFSVFENRDGRERVSIPVRFYTAADSAVTLLEGHSYRAPELWQSFSAKNEKVPTPDTLLRSN